MTEKEIIQRLKMTLSEKRYGHCVGVADTARALAERYHVDSGKAYLAGLLHDCSKYMSGEEMLNKALSFGIPVDDLERAEPGLLHAKVSARIAKEEYGVDDPEILTAIERHIYGAPGMSMLDTLINLADYIEPGRSFPDVVRLRALAKEDPKRALLEGFRGTISMLLGKNLRVHPAAITTYNMLLAESENLHSTEKAL